jgi:dipeptidyl aminopeptidase/acylaminoacyl peptidase
MRRSSLAIAACFLLFLQSTPARQVASPSAGEGPSIERYLNIRSANSPTFSPDGTRLAFLTNITGTPQVWVISAQGGWPDQWTFYQDRVDFVAWSPNGSGLIFGKSRGGDENAQLFWLASDGTAIRALTDEPKVRHNFGLWAHDGRRIAYASNKRNPNFFDVYVMDTASGREELVYQQDGSNSPVAWSFDGRYLIVSRNNEQLSLDNDLYLIDLSTKQITHLTPHTGPALFGDVHFTRDGRAIIFAHNDGREWYQLARMDLRSRRIETLDDAPWDVDATALSYDGQLFAYTLNREGYSELYIREVTDDGRLGPKGAPVQLPGRGVISGLEFSKDGSKLAFVFNGARFNPDIWLYDLRARELTQLTHSARAGLSQSSFVEPELIRYKTFDGREIPAWYYRPQNAQGKLPVIVSVHGGPEGQERPTFNAIYQYFLARGYAILAPNVRGSTGYGKSYTHLDDVRNREDSVKDLAYAVEWLKRQGGADPKRIAVMGGSYGGYMTLAAITLYPDLWAAAVETVGIANFETFLRNTSGYRRKLREVEYGSLERDLDFLRSISPINRVDRIRAPLMVIHGKNDPRVPYTEAEQIVKALRARNHPVEYMLFEDEGHGIAKLSNRLLAYPKVADFLDRYMK